MGKVSVSRRLIIVSVSAAALFYAGASAPDPPKREGSTGAVIGYIPLGQNLIFVSKEASARVAKRLEARPRGKGQWIVPGHRSPLTVIEFDGPIPAALASQPYGEKVLDDMTCPPAAPAPPNDPCVTAGEKSYILKHFSVSQCVSAPNQQCVKVVGAVGAFDFYDNPNCAGTPVRSNVPVSGEKCKPAPISP